MANLAELLAAFDNSQLLRKLIPGTAENVLNQALSHAARQGKSKAVRTLIPNSNPGHPDTMALMEAAQHGHLGVVRQLIHVCDVKAQQSLALHFAAQNGHVQIVRELKAESYVHANRDRALRGAALNGHVAVIAELMGNDAERVFQQQVDRAVIGPDVGTYRLIDELVSHVSLPARWMAARRLMKYLTRVPLLNEWFQGELAQICSNELSQGLGHVPVVQSNIRRRL